MYSIKNYLSSSFSNNNEKNYLLEEIKSYKSVSVFQIISTIKLSILIRKFGKTEIWEQIY